MTRPSNPFDPPQHDEELLVILARLDAEAPDPGVRSSLMAAVAGSPRPALTGMAPLDVFAGCAEDLAELLDELTADEGEGAVSAYDWTVRELIAHLAAVEDHMSVTLGFAPGRDPRSDPDHLSHLAVGADLRRRLLSGPTAAIVSAWQSTVFDTIGRLRTGAGPGADTMVMFHVWPFTVDSLLVARSFEIWTHADDIRRATGRSLTSPPPAALRTMSTLSVSSLPLLVPAVTPRLDVAGTRLVLTGDGGGVHDIGVGERSLTVVGDVIDYCRLAARRSEPSVLEPEGDLALFVDLVSAMQAIAL